MNVVTFEPKFRLEQRVQVQVFNIITLGKIVKREYHEMKKENKIKYWVQFSHNPSDIVEPWEEDLTYAQTLPLGEIK